MFRLRNRTGLHGGFRFFAHDSEHTLLIEQLNVDRTGPCAAGDPTVQGAAAALARSNPQYIFTRLTANAEFRLRVADHVQKHFFNRGALTTQACQARFLTRSNEINRAVVGESARWGYSKHEPPFNRDTNWIAEMKRVYGTYLVQRPGIVLGQLRAKGRYPTLTAPSFSQFGGNVPYGFQLTMSTAAGTIYYTPDGSDPRLLGGAVSSGALIYGGPITLTQSAHVKARALNGGV